MKWTAWVAVWPLSGTLLLAAGAHAEMDLRDDPAQKLPPAVRPFVDKGTRPIYLASGDLNGDGLEDHVLVLQRQGKSDADPEAKEQPRPLLILLGQPGGALKLAKRNEKIVYCEACGGMMGDPFQGVEVGPKTFTVSHYGGSGWRWSVSYRFNYSRRDDTWQLVRVEEESFHAADPEKVSRKVATPPKNFGKIDIADFDPDHWRTGK